jgi:hypothetical protein
MALLSQRDIFLSHELFRLIMINSVTCTRIIPDNKLEHWSLGLSSSAGAPGAVLPLLISGFYLSTFRISVMSICTVGLV